MNKLENVPLYLLLTFIHFSKMTKLAEASPTISTKMLEAWANGELEYLTYSPLCWVSNFFWIYRHISKKRMRLRYFDDCFYHVQFYLKLTSRPLPAAFSNS